MGPVLGEGGGAATTALPIRLRLLGQFSLEVDGTEVDPLDTRSAALLAHLALQREPVPRERLAAVFWPESTQAQARTNLRKVLHRVRTRVPVAEQCLEITQRSAGWRRDASRVVDVHRFEELLGGEDPDPDALREAVGLYRGDLMEGLTEPWVDHERDRLHAIYHEALHTLAHHCEDEGDLAAAVIWARRAADAEPLREESYRQLMRLHARRGERALAVGVYHDLSTTLERELGVPPSAATRSAYAALLPRGTRTPEGAPAQGRFVGRRRERAGLDAAWTAALGGSARLVLLGGEAGIGKTRLAEEFVRWCARQGGAVAQARCLDTEGQLAYGPVTAWLREPALRVRRDGLAEHVRTELARLLPELGAPDRWQGNAVRTEAEQRRLLHEAVAAATLAPTSTVVLSLDDIQHADAETCDVVRHLLGAHPSARLLVVATSRALDVREGSAAGRLVSELRAGQQCTAIELGALSTEETAAVASSLGTELGSEEVRALQDQTGGNPLFVVEAVRAARSGERSLSPRVQAVIETRLNGLSGQTGRLADVAALVGRQFRAEVVGTVAEVDEAVLVDCLDELWRHRIVRECGAGCYEFGHDTIREVAAGRVLPARRRLLHREIARALQRLPVPLEDSSAQVAAHYDLAGEAGLAATAYLEAAQGAPALPAQTHALRLLDRALAQLQQVPTSSDRDRQELAVRCAQLAPVSSARGYAAPELLAAQQRATELTEFLGTEPAPELLRSSAMSALTLGEYAAADAGGQALEQAGRRTGSNALLVEGAFVRGVTAFWQADLERARRHLMSAVHRYRPEEREEHLVHFGNDPKASCLARLGNTFWFLGTGEQAREARVAALGWAAQIEHPYSLGIAAFFGALLALDMGDEELLRADVDTLAEVDSSQLTLGHDALHGHLAVLDGDVAGGLRAIRAAIDRAGGVEAPGLSACLYRVLLAAELAAGDARAVRATAQRLLTMGRGAQVWEPEARRVLAPPGPP